MKGGKRPGAGLSKGFKYPKTINKELEREALRAIVVAEMREMTQAQIDNAKGIKHLMMRDPKTGKFERVAKDTEDTKVAEAQIDAALKSNNAFWIYTKDPNIQAYSDLMNRALDKPAEQEQAIQHQGEIVIKWQS